MLSKEEQVRLPPKNIKKNFIHWITHITLRPDSTLLTESPLKWSYMHQLANLETGNFKIRPSDCSGSSSFLYTLYIYTQTSKSFRFLHRSPLLLGPSFVICCQQIIDLLYLCYFSFFFLRERWRKKWGSWRVCCVEEDWVVMFWGWGGGCWMRTKVLALL